MKHSRASLRYAKALYAAASEKNAVEAVHRDLASIELTLSQNNDLVAVLESPTASSRVKRAYLDQIFTDLNPLIVLIYFLTLSTFDLSNSFLCPSEKINKSLCFDR